MYNENKKINKRNSCIPVCHHFVENEFAEESHTKFTGIIMKPKLLYESNKIVNHQFYLAINGEDENDLAIVY